MSVMLFAIVAMVIGRSIASNIANQVYFNYKTEGLRAIRAMKRMLAKSLVPLAALPVTAALMPASRAAFLGSMLSQPFTQL